jgi:large subunit ribosomal protein L30
VPKKTGTIHIKWVRSGIGFSRKQTEVVRSIGLRRLNQVVERPDTVHFRGLVAKVCHLVEVVEPSSAPVWAGVPEYKIIPADATRKKAAAAPAKKVKAAKEAPVKAPAATEEKAAAPAKKAAATKRRAVKSSAKQKAAPAAAEKPKAKRKPTAPKPAAAAKKESKSKKGKK